MSFRPRSLACAVLAFLGAALTSQPAVRADAPEPDAITVFAAASLKTALDELAKRYTANTGTQVAVSYAGSSALARQIERGAPADVFLSADSDWMDYLAARHAIVPATRIDLLSNTLILIAPRASAVALKIAPGFKLADALGASRLAVADTASVPAGKYAKAALQSLGVWPDVATKLAEAENVRAALALVARQDAALGIVYATDANASANVRIVDTFPASTHPPIVYPVAVTSAARNTKAAHAFVTMLSSPEARAAFGKAGFKVIQK